MLEVIALVLMCIEGIYHEASSIISKKTKKSFLLILKCLFKNHILSKLKVW
jgi:hypothetical protein